MSFYVLPWLNSLSVVLVPFDPASILSHTRQPLWGGLKLPEVKCLTAVVVSQWAIEARLHFESLSYCLSPEAEALWAMLCAPFTLDIPSLKA